MLLVTLVDMESAVIYAVVTQESGSTQGLIAVKSRLEKQGLTIPRLELEYLRAKNVLDKTSTTTKH